MINYEISWYIQYSNTLRIVFRDNWTWDEFHQAHDEANGLVDAKNVACNLLLIYETTATLRDAPLPQFVKLGKTISKNIRTVIIVDEGSKIGTYQFLFSITNLVTRVLPQQPIIKIFRDMEDANKFLKNS